MIESSEIVLLTNDEMARADRAAMAAGVSSASLMERAGRAVAEAVLARWSTRPTVVLCGPGNNGGDGFVAARHLAAAGWPVTVALLGERGALKGDAAHNAERWSRPVFALEPEFLTSAELVIDAIFGAGLARPLAGKVRATIDAIGTRGLPCVAVDVPSGINGDTGAVAGAAAHADVTVTFFRRKPGHLLLPGRAHCGEVIVADIGIPNSVLSEIAPKTYANDPAVWRRLYPWPRPEGHKYDRGHAVVSGGFMTGAGRLAARGALRCGAGLVNIACMPDLAPIYAADRPGVIVRPCVDDDAFAAFVSAPKVSAVLVGPGNGVTDETRARTLAALATGKACVLDADALTVFAGRRKELFRAITGPCVLTPHTGEFARLFVHRDGRLADARAAAASATAHLLLKGPDTVVAGPDGRATINDNAPPELATAGAGDVLAGFLLALMAQGMPVFEAASAAVWLHGAAATAFGPGLIAEDLPDCLPAVLRGLRDDHD